MAGAVVDAALQVWPWQRRRVVAQRTSCVGRRLASSYGDHRPSKCDTVARWVAPGFRFQSRNTAFTRRSSNDSYWPCTDRPTPFSVRSTSCFTVIFCPLIILSAGVWGSEARRHSCGQWRRLHRARGEGTCPHFYRWHGRTPWVEERQTRNWPNCTDHPESAHQNDLYL